MVQKILRLARLLCGAAHEQHTSPLPLSQSGPRTSVGSMEVTVRAEQREFGSGQDQLLDVMFLKRVKQQEVLRMKGDEQLPTAGLVVLTIGVLNSCHTDVCW